VAGNLFPLAVTALFVAAAAFNVSHHELWRDEMEHWLIGKDCSSLWQLITRNTINQGHPLLWSVLIYCCAGIYDSYISMQVLHVAIAAAAVFAFLKYAPFGRLCSALVVFGYFFSFEYCVLARNYALGVLFVVLLAILLARKERSPILIALCLFLLCSSNAYAFLLACAIGAALVLECFIKKDARERILKNRASRRHAGAAVVLFAAGLVLSGYCMLPNEQSSLAGGWSASVSLADRVLSSLSAVHKALLPFPDMRQAGYHFWNTNMVTSDSVAAGISVLLLVYVACALMRTPLSCLSFLLGAGAVVVFTGVKFPGSLRHHGHIYLIFVFSLFLKAFEDRGGIHNAMAARLSDFCERHMPKVFCAVLAVQLAAAAAAHGLNYRYPFSAGKDAADYLKSAGLAHRPIIGNPDLITVTLAGYLDRKIRYANFDRDLTFFPFEKSRVRISDDEFQKRAHRYLVEQQESIVMVTNRELKNESLKLLRCFDKSIVRNEVFWIYLYEYGGQ
jgi:hypothetical protein